MCMLKTRKSIIKFFSIVVLICAVICTGRILSVNADDEGTKAATILFTHDTHSHVYPTYDSDGNGKGGYTKLSTLIKRYRKMYSEDSSVITVDAGDFSMGTLFQAIYMTDACELRMLGAMGYDVVALGNHEFDYRDDGLAAMLETAMASGDKLPMIVNGNYYPPAEGSEDYTDASRKVWEAYENYGVKEYTILERDGVRYAIFGVFGEDSHEYSPMSGMVYEPAVDAAKRIVAEIKENEEYDYIVCLSHSGTDEDAFKSEDHILAKSVDGIDVIVSGHTHTTLTEPIIVNGTIIVSVGEYAKNLGVLRIAKASDGSVKLVDYKLIEVSGGISEDKLILKAANEYKDLIADRYLADYGMEYDQVLAYSDFDFKGISKKQEELPLGNLIADSFIYAVKQAEGKDYIPVDLAIVGNGVIRETFSKGEITVADAFNVLSLGIGPDGKTGYPLVSIYIRGNELKNIFEVDASVTPIMSVAQLYASGMSWTYNTNRMFFNRVTEGWQLTEDGKKLAIDDDKLYRVVTGLYEGQMLSVVKAKSYGILKVTPLDEYGNEITDFEKRIIYDENGNEVKVWSALATYLDSFEEKDGVSVVPERYNTTEERKIVYASLNPIELLKSPNWVTLTVIAVVVVLIAIVVLCVVHHRRRKRRHHKRKKY